MKKNPRNGNPKQASFISGNEIFSVHPEKISYTSGNKNSKKVSYIFSRENFSYISVKGNPKKLLIFQEVTCKA